MTKKTLFEEITDDLMIKFKERAYSKLSDGITFEQLDEIKTIIGEDYYDAIKSIVGHASQNFSIKCSESLEMLQAYDGSKLNKEIEKEIRKQIRNSGEFNVDLVVFAQRIYEETHASFDIIDQIFPVYRGMSEIKGISKLIVASYLAQIAQYCVCSRLDYKNILIKSLYEESDIFEAITKTLSIIFMLTGKTLSELQKQQVLEKLDEVDDVNFQDITAIEMLQFIPLKKSGTYFKKEIYDTGNTSIKRLSDFYSIMMIGHRFKNCLKSFDFAKKFLRKDQELFLVEHNGEGFLFEVSLSDGFAEITSSKKKFNQEIDDRYVRRFRYFLAVILKKEEIPFQIVDKNPTRLVGQEDLFHPPINEVLEEVENEEFEEREK